MSNAIAYREGCNPVPGLPIFDRDLAEMIRHYIQTLNVVNSLKTFESALKQLPNFEFSSKDHYFLLLLDANSHELEMWGYPLKQMLNAYKHYSQIEKEIRGKGKNAVLVSVGSVDELKRAYPNYFLNTSIFLDLVDWAIREY